MTTPSPTLVIPRWAILLGIFVHLPIALAIVFAHTSGLHHDPRAGAESGQAYSGPGR